MIDFLKNNKLIAGVALAILLLLVVVVFVIISLFNNKTTTPPEDVSFGEMGEREVLTDEEFLFGTSGEKWLATEGSGVPAPDFRALSKTPAIGAITYERTMGEQYVRFTSRTNGNVFDVPLAVVGAEERITNETILRIGRVGWAHNSSATFTQYLDKTGEKIETYLRSFTDSTVSTTSVGTTTPKGRLLEENIVTASLSPRGDRLFYIVKTDKGTVGYIETVATGKRAQVWSSILSNLTSSWNTEDMLLIYSNPSSLAEGVLWSLKPSTGAIQDILRNGYALAAKTNTTGTKILFSTQEPNTKAFSLQVLEIKTGKVTKLGLATMVEKCVWGADGSKYVYCAIPRQAVGGDFLEKWYMGTVASDDMLWRLDTEIGISKMLLDPKEQTGVMFDVVDMHVSPQENYLVFRTKVASVLWSLKLAETSENVTQSTTTPQTGTVGAPL